MTCSRVAVLCGMWQVMIGGTYARVRSLNICTSHWCLLTSFVTHSHTHTLGMQSTRFLEFTFPACTYTVRIHANKGWPLPTNHVQLSETAYSSNKQSVKVVRKKKLFRRYFDALLLLFILGMLFYNSNAKLATRRANRWEKWQRFCRNNQPNLQPTNEHKPRQHRSETTGNENAK